MKPIHLRNVPPPLETFDHVSLIQWIAGWIRPERYLELGVRDGKCFLEVAPYCEEAIAVDYAEQSFSLPNNAQYHKVYTDDYFESIKNLDMKFDMVFIDADHSFNQSYKDFVNVKDMVIQNGFVFFHDTYPYDKDMTSPIYSGDCYKTPIEIKKNFSDEWELVTLPFNPGVTICKKIYSKFDMPWIY